MELKPEVKELAEVIFKTKYPYTTNSVVDQDSIFVAEGIIKAGYRNLSLPSEMKVISDEEILKNKRLSAEQLNAVVESLKDFQPKEFKGLEENYRVQIIKDRNIAQAQLAANQQVEARLKARIKELEETLKEKGG